MCCQWDECNANIVLEQDIYINNCTNFGMQKRYTCQGGDDVTKGSECKAPPIQGAEGALSTRGVSATVLVSLLHPPDPLAGMQTRLHVLLLFITRGVEGRGDKKEDRKATRSLVSTLASRKIRWWCSGSMEWSCMCQHACHQHLSGTSQMGWGEVDD